MCDEELRRWYEQRGFAQRVGFGKRPALLIIDFIVAFTDPGSPLASQYDAQLAATRELLAAARQKGVPVFFTTVEYEEDLRDAGVFIKKVPSLRVLKKGSPMTAIDERIAPRAGEHVIVKKYASAFFGTSLASTLTAMGCDTILIVGCTTSGCVRASAVDSCQHGFRTIVVREAVGDRAPGPHEANLFDIDMKYGDVVSLSEALEYLSGAIPKTENE
ncbi:MAG: N-carbamoylsarcosine amidohydrolase [Blastocatellia bacterium]|nr:N-carbamoylsarcosine amidohydrolase [Blastocatellia bacterium]MDW8166883.1 N-carbamoylsarcosine amidohydrolase [Acidobacteriota bacterium]